MPSIFPFVEKEGKFFSPIVSNVPRYRVAAEQSAGDSRIQTRDGIWVEPDDMLMTEKSGTKGTFARIRFRSGDTNKNELFAVNTEWFASSN